MWRLGRRDATNCDASRKMLVPTSKNTCHHTPIYFLIYIRLALLQLQNSNFNLAV
jgi:hypothetical protein